MSISVGNFLHLLINGTRWKWDTGSIVDADIKALVTTPQTLVAAPGANKIIAWRRIELVGKFSAGAYTNVNTTEAGVYATLGTADASDYILNYNADSFVRATAFLNTAGTQYATVLPWRGISAGYNGANPLVFTSTEAINTPLKLTAFNNGAGDFTGGNAANTLKWWVEYTILDV